MTESKTAGIPKIFLTIPIMFRQQWIRRELEGNSKWLEAANCWKYIGCIEDYNACMMLHRAISWGNSYREAVRPIISQIDDIIQRQKNGEIAPEKMVEEGKSLKELQSELHTIYRRYYDSTTAGFLFDYL